MRGIHFFVGPTTTGDKPMSNIMLDIETLGTRSTSVILSIGVALA